MVTGCRDYCKGLYIIEFQEEPPTFQPPNKPEISLKPSIRPEESLHVPYCATAVGIHAHSLRTRPTYGVVSTFSAIPSNIQTAQSRYYIMTSGPKVGISQTWIPRVPLASSTCRVRGLSNYMCNPYTLLDPQLYIMK